VIDAVSEDCARDVSRVDLVGLAGLVSAPITIIPCVLSIEVFV